MVHDKWDMALRRRTKKRAGGDCAHWLIKDPNPMWSPMVIDGIRSFICQQSLYQVAQFHLTYRWSFFQDLISFDPFGKDFGRRLTLTIPRIFPSERSIGIVPTIVPRSTNGRRQYATAANGSSKQAATAVGSNRRQ